MQKVKGTQKGTQGWMGWQQGQELPNTGRAGARLCLLLPQHLPASGFLLLALKSHNSASKENSTAERRAQELLCPVAALLAARLAPSPGGWAAYSRTLLSL